MRSARTVHGPSPTPARASGARTGAALCALVLALVAPAPGRAQLLPETPSQGLRITVEVSCDFEDRWWEAAFSPGADLPLEFSAEDRVGDRRRERSSQRAIDAETRDQLYTLARAAFDTFSVDRRPVFGGADPAHPWTGERTLMLAAMTLDDELGRVDRVDLSIDVLRGRGLPSDALALVEAVSVYSRLASLELDCT